MRYLILTLPLLMFGCDNVRNTASDLGGFLKPAPKAEPTQTAVPAPDAVTEEALPTEQSGDVTPLPSGPSSLPASGVTTIAGLGDPSIPGLWMETPLVGNEQAGRVVFAGTGAELRVALKPIAGAETAGSRLSLDAMRQLGIPLTELVEIRAFPAF
ncbi:hypothetical protein QEZ52_14615 [Aliisedimentitalea scapharcae]|uniref:D-galactarate dehydratase n=1 Tax=Aliisedimentitalea scapharcae TaxID=1524259 RepID=A0ABZ2XP27_9RHOB